MWYAQVKIRKRVRYGKSIILDSPMKEKLYGSRRIQEKFGLGPMDKKIGEYWAISAHDNGLSKIKNGKYKGKH